jgi:hypothetical protein
MIVIVMIPKYLERNLYESHCVHHTAHVADGSANAIKTTFPFNTYFCIGCSCTQNLFKNHSIITLSQISGPKSTYLENKLLILIYCDFELIVQEKEKDLNTILKRVVFLLHITRK